MNKKSPSIQELKDLCLKKGVYVGLDTIISRMAIYPTKLFLYTPLKPMQVMFVWFIVQLVACYVITQGGYVFVMLGIILFHAAIILDHADGQMARYLGGESILALYVDQLYHNITNPLFILSLAYVAGIFWIGVIMVAIYLFNRVIIFNPHIYNLTNERMENAIHQTIDQDQKKLSYSRRKAHEKNSFGKIYEWFRIEHPLSIIFWGALVGLLQWTLYLYLALFSVDLIRRLYLQLSSLRRADKILNKKDLEEQA
ncbi:hypothetical protein HYX14_03145 [Candidatus Woesearchaeota archaeon]|nr:hypothetical protein [Candidatus Woesearchaeota archaeon]